MSPNGSITPADQRPLSKSIRNWWSEKTLPNLRLAKSTSVMRDWVTGWISKRVVVIMGLSLRFQELSAKIGGDMPLYPIGNQASGANRNLFGLTNPACTAYKTTEAVLFAPNF